MESQTDRRTAARTRARELLLDHLAVVHRGAASPPAIAARTLLDAEGGAVVDGTARTAPAADAAFANGIAAHAIELDDTYEPASLHPGVVVWPPLLALADERDATVGELLDAAIAGYDVVCALGDRLDPGEAYARGFHPTGVCGPIGAAVATGRLLGLDPAQQRDAIGIAASAASGLLEFLADGAWTKPFHAGYAARSGLDAARLAAAGYRGPATAIEGARGFLHAFGGRGDTTVPLAEPPYGHGVLGTAVKRYPCCRYVHGTLDLLLELVAQEGIEPGDVASLSCGVPAAGWGLVADPIAAKRRIAGTVDAQFSMPFAAALALTERAATLDGFARAAELGPRLAPLMERIACHRSERIEAGYPAVWGAEIELRTSGGTVLRRAQPAIKGSPAHPLSQAELRDKAAALVGETRAAELLAACVDVTEDAPVSALRAVRALLGLAAAGDG